MAVEAGHSPALTRAGDAKASRRIVDLRLSSYAVCLCVAFGLYLLVHGRGHGAAFWTWGLVALLSVIYGALRRDKISTWLRGGTGTAAILALSVPFGLVAVTGAPIAHAHPLWPSMLVLLFASRVLGEMSNATFDAFWTAPLDARAPVQIQSGAAALALGGFLTLLLYELLSLSGIERPFGTSLAGVLLGAVTGETAIHRGIVFLFFVIVAHLLDSALRHRREREAFKALQAAAASPTRPRGVDAFVEAAAGPFGQTRTALLVRAIADGGGTTQEARATTFAYDTFQQASRRFVRGLVTLLPLLGFLGTVVGLATAMGALPIDGAAGGRVDLTASLAGLALKFETTMLGLVASMIAALLLAGLDRSEAEHAAACALFADTLHARDAG